MKHMFSSDLFVAATAALEKKGIRFFILRNFEGLPESNPSKDVDILIKPNDLKEAVDCFKDKANQLGYKLVWRNYLDYLYGFVFMKIEGGVIFSMKVDLFRSFSWRGMDYIDDTKLFEGSIKHNGFYVLQPADEAFTMIWYYVLYAKTIHQKYLGVIRSKALLDEDRFLELLGDHLEEKIAKEILICVQEERVGDVIFLRYLIIKSVIARNIKFTTLINMVKHAYSVIYNFRNPFRVLLNVYIKKRYGDKHKFIWDSLAGVGVVRSSYSKLTPVFFSLLKTDESI